MGMNLPKIKLKTTSDYAKEMTNGAGLGKHMDGIVRAAAKGASLATMMKPIGNAMKGVSSKKNGAPTYPKQPGPTAPSMSMGPQMSTIPTLMPRGAKGY